MLRPPKIKDPDRVVAILMTDPSSRDYGWDQNPVSMFDFANWRAHSRSFDAMVAGESDEVALTGKGEPERLVRMRVTADYFNVLGIDAAVGRTFVSGEDQSGRAQVVVLGYGLWQRRFGSDPNVIGKSVRLNGENFAVAGVMPATFRIGYYGPQLWTPLVFPPEHLLPAGRADRRLQVLARMKPEVTVETARVEISALAQRAEQSYPGTTKGWGATAMVLQKYIADEFKVAMRIQMGAVLLVLLIACANIASLHLTRAAARQTEIAVRMSLGASRLRIVRQLLVESLLLGLAGGGLGLLLATWGVGAFRRSLNWSDYVRLMALEVTIDSKVLVYTFFISILAAMLFGIAPAFLQTGRSLHLTFQEGGRTVSHSKRRRRVHSSLVTAQVALAVVLLGGAGLDIWTFVYRVHAGFGLDPNRVLTAQVHLSNSRYKDNDKQSAFFREALERLQTIPGVIASGATTALLPRDPAPLAAFSIASRAVLPRSERPKTQYFGVNSQFFDTLHVTLLRGRGFDAHDAAGTPRVIIVNQEFARRFFRDDEPLGKRLRVDTEDSERPDWSEIVGVVANVKNEADEWQDLPQVYEPYLQRPASDMTLLIRTRSDPAEFASLLRSAIWSIDKDQPVDHIQTMEQAVTDSLAGVEVVTTFMGSFAGLALTMAMVGVFGVVGYTVQQRIHEIGIRMALGAGKKDVLKMVTIKGVILGAIGVGVGVLLVTPFLWLPTGLAPGMPFHYQVSVFLAAVAVLWLVVFVASYLPARRAAGLDPIVALHHE